MIRSRIVAAGAFALAAVAAQAQIFAGQVEPFTSGLGGWIGANPVWQSGGGPGGAADGYMRLTSTGGTGPASRMAFRNAINWAGNYASAGVASISIDYRNFGNTDLQMRLVLFDLVGGMWVSNNPVVLAAGSGWQTGTYQIQESQMTLVQGSPTFAQSISGINQLMFRHDPGFPSSTGEAVAATLGVDNIRANPVPEPVTLLVLGIGVFAARRGFRSRS